LAKKSPKLFYKGVEVTFKEWEPSDLALPDTWEYHKDEHGQIIVSFEWIQLLRFLANNWRMPPSFDGHTVHCYLNAVFRMCYFTHEWVLPLVLEELKTHVRKYKPTPEYLQALCGAAITMQRAWGDIGFSNTYAPQEPNRWVRPNVTQPKRHKRRVLPLPDDED
jgi:hypothetical protein